MQISKSNLFLLFFILSQIILGNNNRKVLFDKEWKFKKESIDDAYKECYDDSGWRVLDLPHDWSIEHISEQIEGETIGPFSRKSPGGSATGQTIGGVGWYRKDFVISKQDKNKRHELYFEGIYNQSEVWVNGVKVSFNAYGYTTFRVDITEYCKKHGEKNVIAIKVINEGKNSRWYTGSGIYRHVWLITKPNSYIDDWGTSIHTDSLSNSKSYISFSSKLIFGEKVMNKPSVKIEIENSAGDIVYKNSEAISSFINDTVGIPFKIIIKDPELWSVDTPNLYSLKFSLLDNGKIHDEIEIPFGIRTIKFSVENGFELNGVKINLKGGCVHHDNGLLGAASFDDAEERKIKLLKENGFNAVRGSHNPMSESFMNACDKLGMLVINEAFDQWKRSKKPDDYHKYFDQSSALDIRNLVLRDRNRPSVIMWSIGNEIRERITENGKNIAGYLKSEILKYDNTRPITAGVNKHWDKQRKNMLPLDNAFHHLDIAGYNYMWRFYEEKHAKFPQRIMYGSESVATEASQNWDKVEKYSYVIGDFIWTAMDYLGESGIGNSIEINPEENVHQFMDWPWYNGWCGDIDILGVKKSQSYYRDVLWGIRSISMAVESPVMDGKIRKVSFWGWPEESLSWTFPGMEGKLMTVNVYSKAPYIRLYLNDELIGEAPISSEYKASFKVPYAKGNLRAVELYDGKEKQSVALYTVGKPSKIKITPDKTVLSNNGQDLAYLLIELTDKDGNILYDSDKQINITGSGEGCYIIGSGNGAPNDMHSFQSLTPKLFKGRAMVILRSKYKKGKYTISVSAEGIPNKKIIIKTVNQ